MKRLFTILIITFFSTLVIAQNSDNKFETLIKQCSSINSQNFKCNSYLNLANYIQSLEKNQAIELIKEYANTYQYEDQIIILTRMLFQSKNDSVLRRPYLGAAFFFSDTDYNEWPTEPIEIINNIPFLILGGYSLGGLSEPSLNYLEYCIENGEWTENIYSVKTEEELQAGLNVLLNDKKWNKELSTTEKLFFEKQIEK
ncbi:MAG: hypothetical protein PHH30_10760 [Bacteroidales bacterium]|nr:hypothetical protein [Bacteroidales bacterium]